MMTSGQGLVGNLATSALVIGASRLGLLVLTTGILIFQAGNAFPIDTWGRNDRVFIDVKWSF